MTDPPAKGPAPGGERHETSQTAAGDGLALVGEHHLLADPRSRIVLVHGYGEHRGRYRRLVGELVAAGHECHLLDLRGHGESEGRRGHVADFADYRDDLGRFLEGRLPNRPGETTPAPPTVLLGHSMGGLLVLDFVLHESFPFAGLVLSSPFLAPAFEATPLIRFLVGAAAGIAPWIRVPTSLGPEGLSHDPEVLAAYASDPLVFSTVTPKWAAAVFAAQGEVRRRAGEVRLPALMLLGAADPIANPARGREVFARLGSPDKRLVEYEGFLHEVLNERGRQRVVDELLGWLDAHSSPIGATRFP